MTKSMMAPMTPEQTDHNRSAREQQLLTDFLQKLAVARRNLSLYPPEHPNIATSNTSALQPLLRLLDARENLNLGVTPDALLLDQQWLDKENRPYKDFANFLFTLGVAAIRFERGMTFSELLRFNQLLRADRDSIEAAGGWPKLLQAQQISHIDISPIDYSAFQALSDAEFASTPESKQLWETYLQGLMTDSLAIDGGGFPWPEQFDPEIVATILNQRLANTTSGIDANRAAQNIVTRMMQSNSGQPRTTPIAQLPLLLERLSPELRESFLNSTLTELDQHPEDAEQVLSNFPRELLLETLEQKNQQQLKISSRLVSLVQRLSSSHGLAHETQAGEETPREKEIIRARLDVLFSEEDQDLYMPGDYQSALREILDEDLSQVIPEEHQRQLRNTLEIEHIERQCCEVIFEILASDHPPENEAILQQNLVELSRFFLDTGDFVTLREIYQRWSEFLNSAKSVATLFDEQVLTNHSQPSFIAEVLDGIDLWGKEKTPELVAYIAEVGPAYTEPLIERLAGEPKRFMRQIWMDCLKQIGADAHQLIVEALKDQRWYLIRNLLIILGQHPETASVKIVHQFIDYPHPKVREEAIRLLFRFNPATANRQLLKELSSDDPEDLLAAAQVAHLSQDPVVLQQLHQLLGEELRSDYDLLVKSELLDCLARIGNETSLTVLQRLLRPKKLLLSRRQKQFQQQIVSCLARFPRRLAEPFLQQLVASRQRGVAKLAKEQLALLVGGAA